MRLTLCSMDSCPQQTVEINSDNINLRILTLLGTMSWTVRQHMLSKPFSDLKKIGNYSSCKPFIVAG